MTKVQAICFDLDDTLWDLAPVIPRAERALYTWYEACYPAVAERYRPEDILALRQQVAHENPELRHDLTALRMHVLRQVAVNSGYTPDIATEAFRVFQETRNQVDLYADVLPALNRLGGAFRLLTLSNGNADLEVIGIAQHFSTSYSAKELGVAKPDAAIFHAVCESEGLAAEQVMHVGDHPENDIVAAQRAGLVTVWVNRGNLIWPRVYPAPHYTVACLEELASCLLDGDAR